MPVRADGPAPLLAAKVTWTHSPVWSWASWAVLAPVKQLPIAAARPTHSVGRSEVMAPTHGL